MKIANAKNTTKNTITIFYQSNIFDYYIMKNGTITEILHLFAAPQKVDTERWKTDGK